VYDGIPSSFHKLRLNGEDWQMKLLEHEVGTPTKAWHKNFRFPFAQEAQVTGTDTVSTPHISSSPPPRYRPRLLTHRQLPKIKRPEREPALRREKERF